MTTTHDTHPQYKLRMPPELHEQIKKSAKENHRSMNAEMVARLQESFDLGAESNLDSLKSGLNEEYLRLARGLLHELGVKPNKWK